MKKPTIENASPSRPGMHRVAALLVAGSLSLCLAHCADEPASDVHSTAGAIGPTGPALRDATPPSPPPGEGPAAIQTMPQTPTVMPLGPPMANEP